MTLDNTLRVLGKVLLDMHVSLSIQMDNWRRVSVCSELLGVLCVFPPRVLSHMPRVATEQTVARRGTD